MEWRSKWQATTSDIRAGIRIAEMLEFSWIRQPEILGRADNDSLRLAVERGSSTNLGQMRNTAEVNIKVLEDDPDTVGTSGEL